MNSIIQDEKVCFFCGNPTCYDHHIYFASNRKASEKYGFKVWLCLDHHTAGKFSPHQNRETDLYLKKLCQEMYEETHSREEFRAIVGRSYL